MSKILPTIQGPAHWPMEYPMIISARSLPSEAAPKHSEVQGNKHVVSPHRKAEHEGKSPQDDRRMGISKQQHGRTNQEIEESHEVRVPKTIRKVADDHASRQAGCQQNRRIVRRSPCRVAGVFQKQNEMLNHC